MLEVFGGKIGADGILFDDGGAGSGFTAYTNAQGGLIGSSQLGGTYPFNVNGNLLIASRTNGTARDIVFATGATPAERMVIQGTGNVGIGTASPLAMLEVMRDSRSPVFIGQEGTGTSYGIRPFIGFNSYAEAGTVSRSSTDRGGAILQGYSSIAANDSRFSISLIGPAGQDEGLLFMKGGNVGIGTSSLGARLHVADPGTGAYTARFGTGAVSQFANVDVIANSGTNAFQVWDDNYLTTPRFIVKRAGNVGIGVASPSLKLNVGSNLHSSNDGILLDGILRMAWGTSVGNPAVGNYYIWYDSGDSTLKFRNSTPVTAYLSSTGVWTDGSDIAYKKDIQPINYGLSELMQLKPRHYRMKTDNLAQIGFIAQEVEKVLPELVSGQEGQKGLSYGQMNAVIVKAIQEQQKKIEEQESRLQKQEKDIEYLKQELIEKNIS